jgi:hypothetical protein
MEVIEDQYAGKEKTTTLPVKETFRFKVTKNKTWATKHVEDEYTQLSRDTDVAKAGTIVEDEYIFDLTMHHLVEKTKAGTYVLPGIEAFGSQKALQERISSDGEFRGALKRTLLDRMLKA